MSQELGESVQAAARPHDTAPLRNVVHDAGASKLSWCKVYQGFTLCSRRPMVWLFFVSSTLQAGSTAGKISGKMAAIDGPCRQSGNTPGLEHGCVDMYR